jgi:hypothetical protein
VSRDANEEELTLLLAPEVERELGEALRAAWSPSELDPNKNEALIALAIDDPLAPASEEEIAESERLRRALEGDGQHPLSDLARALAAATRPAALGKSTAARLDAELTGEPPPDRATESERAPSSTARRGTVIYVMFGAAAATLALAASIALFVGPLRKAPESGDVAARMQDLALSRSTAAMFQEKFETGETTARVDRIATARERELRSNRYALWGVR